MSKFYIETEGSSYVFNTDLDIGVLTKSMLNDEVDGFCKKQLNVLERGKAWELNNKSGEINKGSLAKDDKFISKEGEYWFVYENNKKQKFVDYLVNEGKLDPNVLGDKYYQKIKEQYAKNKGESYTKEDFDKEVLIGQNNFQLVENMELTQELNKFRTRDSEQVFADKDIQAQEIHNATENTSNDDKDEIKPKGLKNSAVKVSPDELINYINDNSRYEFPYNDNVLRDYKTMHAFRERLQKEKIETLRDMLEKLKAKNEKLKAEINDYKQADMQKIEKELKENASLTKKYEDLKAQNKEIPKEMKNGIKQTQVEQEKIKKQPVAKQEQEQIKDAENEMNNIRAEYDPNDNTAMNEFRKEHFEKEASAKQEAKEQDIQNQTRRQK